MIKVKNINRDVKDSDMGVTSSKTEMWGGSAAYKRGKIKEFNDKYSPQGYMIKPVNAAADGNSSNEWWINTFLVFNVDGRCLYRDRGTSLYPSHVISGSLSADDCWVKGRSFLSQHEAEVRDALREFPGFENMDFVFDTYGYPLVGEVPYIRETVHMARFSYLRNHGTEDTNYAVTANASLNAGTGPNDGADAAYYDSRIGVAYYWMDLHPYSYTDYKNGDEYISGMDSYLKMRGDIIPESMTAGEHIPRNPVYLPYKVLTTEYIANLLNPGYATGVSGISWGEIRVLPNLCALGDAAGAAAAYCVQNSVHPLYVSSSGISTIRSNLVNKIGARMEKPKK